MGRNRVFDDADHVNDEPTIIRKSKISSSKSWPMPEFKSFPIKNGLLHDLGKLFQHVSRTSYDVFSLFFIEEILQKLINYINEYGSSSEIDIEDKSYARTWFSTIVKELRAYIVTFIYMDLHTEACIEDFWNTKPTKAIHLPVSIHISLKR